jgi:hypothetical protein
MTRRDAIFTRERRRHADAPEPTVPCTYCGDPLLREEATLDHVEPKSRGGSKVVIACHPCNNTKSDLPLEVFLAWLKSEAGQTWIARGPDRPSGKLRRAKWTARVRSAQSTTTRKKRSKYAAAMIFEVLPTGERIRIR